MDRRRMVFDPAQNDWGRGGPNDWSFGGSLLLADLTPILFFPTHPKRAFTGVVVVVLVVVVVHNRNTHLSLDRNR